MGMDVIQKKLNTISRTEKITTVKEDFETCTVTFETSKPERSIEYNELTYLDKIVSETDSYEVIVTLDDDDDNNYHFYPQSIDQDEFEMMNKSICESDKLFIKYEIKKRIVDHNCNVYDLKKFIKGIEERKAEHIFNLFNNYFFDKNVRNLIILDKSYENLNLYTTLFRIVSPENRENQDDLVKLNREQILRTKDLHTNAQGFSKYKFLPEDFNILSKDGTNLTYPFHNLFLKLKVIFSVLFLSNSSNIINEDRLDFLFLGHHSVDIRADFCKLKVNKSTAFFDIYTWVYNSENDVNEKISLTRNIIVRYFRNTTNTWTLPFDTLNSIQSSHAIYLKENVEKYIETKNKVAELTTELSIRSKELADFILTSFKNNNITLVGFFASVIVINALTSTTGKLFTIEIFIITLLFIFISFLYLCLSLRQIEKDLKVYQKYFFSVKKIYSDIFAPRELDKLFNKKNLKNNTKYIRETQTLYRNVWLAELFLIGFISAILTFFEPNNLLNINISFPSFESVHFFIKQVNLKNN